MKPFSLFKWMLLLLTIGPIAALGQREGGTRVIDGDIFAQRRQAQAGGNVSPSVRDQARAGAKSKVSYSLVRTENSKPRWKLPASLARPSSTKKPTVPSSVASETPSSSSTVISTPGLEPPAVYADIGVTIWKLRPTLPSDIGVTIPVLMPGGKTANWTAERASQDERFSSGDRIRLAIESPTNGFLYIINSEVNADGSYGAPRLIFPDPPGQNNSVAPGMLVDLPDQKENFPYFKLSPKKGDYAGELIAIIISPTRLDFTIGKEKEIVGADPQLDFGERIEFEVFKRLDQNDSLYTQTEADAACGARTRELVREESFAKPCGAESRSLTRTEPLPQSIYRAKTTSGRPATVLIRLETR